MIALLFNGILAVILLKRTRTRAIIEDAFDYMTELVTIEDDQGNTMQIPRQRLLMASMANDLGGAMAKQFRMAFLGESSGDARLQKGLEKAFALDLLEAKAPLLSMLDGFTGDNLKKFISRNPRAALKLGSQLFARMQGTEGLKNMASGYNPKSKNRYRDMYGM